MAYLFKCPLCKRLHQCQDGENPNEVGCPDNATSEIRDNVRDNPNRYTMNEWNMNKFDIKVRDYTNDVEFVGVGRHNSHPKKVKNW